METKKKYSTKQRNYILDFFKTRQNECFSAKQLIENKDFDMGEATIYRLLVRLSAEGNLKRFISDKGKGATYQYNNAVQCDSHFHLKCVTCGETLCIDCSHLDDMEKHMEDEHKFTVDNTKTVLYGFCKECK